MSSKDTLKREDLEKVVGGGNALLTSYEFEVINPAGTAKWKNRNLNGSNGHLNCGDRFVGAKLGVTTFRDPEDLISLGDGSLVLARDCEQLQRV